MPSNFPGSPKLQKGTLVKLEEEFLGPVPNVIVFQYNPETLTRDLRSSSGSRWDGSPWKTEATTEPFDPEETFDLTLVLDAADALEEPEKHPTAVVSGVADRIAALEMLLYPVGDTLLGKAKAPTSLGDAKRDVPQSKVPIVLFIWGPGRILPVRLISFRVEEQMFSPTLYPIRATVSVSLQVLTDQAFNKPEKDLSACEKMAIAAYKWTRGQKEVLARANLKNTAESLSGLLPL